MAKMILSARFVQTAVCPPGKAKEDIFDIGCKGLMLEIRASGGKTYYLRYSDKRGRIRQLRIADQRDVTLAQARQLADAKRAEIALGRDPAEEKKTLREVRTVEAFMVESYLPHIKTYKRAWPADDSYLRNHILPAIGRKYMDEVKPTDLIKFQHSMREKGYALGTCNRCLVLIRYAFNLAKRWGEPGVTENPTKEVTLYKLDNQKERFLSPEETRRLLDCVARSDNGLLQYIIRMLILTGARKREVLDCKWADFDMARMLWTIPITKAGKPRHVPISDAVVSLLNEIPKTSGIDYLFPNPKTGKPFISIFYSWDTARTEAGLADVRIHDLRHSFASFLVNAGRSLYEVQKLLGHTQIKTTQRYAHLSHDTLREAANAAMSAIAQTAG
ncbi:site-specific integrase [Orrella daihaiensis]|uniref:Tyrosine-type recombinase/integrase n=1 Tax=Orrella daihaiensis TaxID=2782176 RepID=A0ABY4AK20_9BURK|nr:site-specific integrase [Orrella daihaiensis]UOD50423.1 tyrosine-type recombinase/integrase [Orrella daihaiensis]